MKKARTLKDLKNDPRIELIEREHDECFAGSNNPAGNYWVYLKPGYQVINRQSHIIHEPTIRKVCEVLNNSVIEWPDDPDKF